MITYFGFVSENHTICALLNQKQGCSNNIEFMTRKLIKIRYD